MEKNLCVVIFAIFLCLFGQISQTQNLSAYYPCEFLYPGETGNCEGCGNLSPTDCHRDCTPGYCGYNCSQKPTPAPQCLSLSSWGPVQDECHTYKCSDGNFYHSSDYCLQVTSNGCYNSDYWDGIQCKRILYCSSFNYMNTCNSMPCASGYHHTTPGDNKCVKDYTPDPIPLPLCTVNTFYSATSSQKPCTCPGGSVYTPYYTGLGHTPSFSFQCVSTYVPPSPTQVMCEIDTEIVFFGYGNRCACPYPSTEVSTSGSYGYHFKCVSQQQPPTYCWDGSVGYGSTSCPQYKYCSRDYTKHSLSYSCYTQPVMQTCSDGTIIPTTSTCSKKITCMHNQYWNGYSCVSYYQPYYPLNQDLNHYSSTYDAWNNLPTYNWSNDTLDSSYFYYYNN